MRTGRVFVAVDVDTVLEVAFSLPVVSCCPCCPAGPVAGDSSTFEDGGLCFSSAPTVNPPPSFSPFAPSSGVSGCGLGV